MKQSVNFKHEFVTAIPEKLKEHTLYVSMEYSTAAHKCACGCGHEINTPLSPRDWKLTFDGESVSLNPSIGNWGLPCRAHYFIKGGRVSWAGEMTCVQVESGRASNRGTNESRKKSIVQPGWITQIIRRFVNLR